MIQRLKLYFAILGFVLAAAGVLLDDRRVIWLAMGVLLLALILRLWLDRRSSRSNNPAA